MTLIDVNYCSQKFIVCGEEVKMDMCVCERERESERERVRECNGCNFVCFDCACFMTGKTKQTIIAELQPISSCKLRIVCLSVCNFWPFHHETMILSPTFCMSF